MMESISIEINNRRKVYTIQDLFNHAFPGLKLEFYSKPNTSDGPHPEKIVTNTGLTIGDCRTVNHDGTLVIEPGMTTTELKNYLSDTFGLKVEIYQWNGSFWQVADRDKRSLEELNGPSGFAL